MLIPLLSSTKYSVATCRKDPREEITLPLESWASGWRPVATVSESQSLQPCVHCFPTLCWVSTPHPLPCSLYSGYDTILLRPWIGSSLSRGWHRPNLATWTPPPWRSGPTEAFVPCLFPSSTMGSCTDYLMFPPLSGPGSGTHGLSVMLQGGRSSGISKTPHLASYTLLLHFFFPLYVLL